MNYQSEGRLHSKDFVQQVFQQTFADHVDNSEALDSYIRYDTVGFIRLNHILNCAAFWERMFFKWSDFVWLMIKSHTDYITKS